MDSTAAQWPPQDIVGKPMEEMVRCPKGGVERKIRPQKEQILNCPRCNSTNTKFCYYNNYSLSQPRYFCKTCRRYWTEGGSLRNIPVGGGSRKNKRPSSAGASSSSAAVLNSSSSKRLPDLVPPLQNPNNPNKVFDSSRDLNLGFALHHHHHHHGDMIGLVPSSSSSSPLELLTGLAATSRAFMPDAAAMYSSSSGLGLGFQLPEFKPSSLGFSLDGLGSGGGGGYGSFQGVEEANGKLLFPFEDLKQVSNNGGEESRDQNGDHHNSTGYWNGVIGGGSW